MTEIFLKLVNMSLSAGWLILAVLVLRMLLVKAPKTVRCALWCLVGLKLIMPFSVESVMSLIPSTEVISRETLYATNPTIDSGIEIVNQTLNPILAENFAPNPGDSVNPLQVVTAVAAFVWAVGVVVFLLYTIFSYLRLRRRVDGAIRLQGNIYQSEAVESPFVLGVIRPRIYIPFSLKEEELQCVLAHEMAHIKRGDHLWKPLGFLLLTVYWFQPLVWLAYVLLCRDIELACDEKVMRQIGMEHKKVYSQALLNCSISHEKIAACPLAFGEVGVKQRIQNVLSYKKPTFWIVTISVIACVVCAVCFLTEPKSERKEGQNEAENHVTLTEDVEGEKKEGFGEEVSAPEELIERVENPPTLKLHNSLSSTLAYFHVEDSGTYTWNYVDGSLMMVGMSADGPVPQDAVKGKPWLRLVSYNQLDYVPYTFEFSLPPDEIIIREYDLLDLADMNAEVISETVYQESFVSISLKARRIYEVIATWGEENLENNKCYGTVHYAFATDNTIKYDAIALEKVQEPSKLILGDEFTEEVNNFEGVTMLMEKYKSTEGDVEISNGTEKEIIYGEYYDIQVQSEGKWYSIQLPEGIAYNAIGYSVGPGETGVWQVNWEYAYGELPVGKYRMVKDAMDFRAPGDFDKYYLAVEFEIKE